MWETPPAPAHGVMSHLGSHLAYLTGRFLYGRKIPPEIFQKTCGEPAAILEKPRPPTGHLPDTWQVLETCGPV